SRSNCSSRSTKAPSRAAPSCRPRPCSRNSSAWAAPGFARRCRGSRTRAGVEPRQGSGVYVAGHGTIRPLRIDYAEAVEPGSVVQILALRRAIEAEVASEGAMRRSDTDMMSIDAALARIDAAVAEGEDGVSEDFAFHRAIAAATGNPYFLKTL